MLTDAQVREYDQRGFVIPDYRIAADVLEEIKERHARVIARKPEFTDYCPAVLKEDIGFKKYAEDPVILDMVEQLIGPDFALWNCSFFAKPALTGSRTPWHQDGEYWPIRPLATCSVWLAVDAATQENGCLRMIPGSHKLRKLAAHRTNDGPGLALNRELLESEYDEAEAVDLLLEPGQFSLHDVYLLHGSEPNRSPHPRRGMTMRFMPTTSVFDRATAEDQAKEYGLVDHTKREIFLMRGIDRSGTNEFANA
jgi:hypothetical protein